MFCEIDNALADDFILKSSQPDFFFSWSNDSFSFTFIELHVLAVPCIHTNILRIRSHLRKFKPNRHTKHRHPSHLVCQFFFRLPPGVFWIHRIWLATPRCFRISAVRLPCEVPTLDLDASCQKLQYYFKFNFGYSASDLLSFFFLLVL